MSLTLNMPTVQGILDELRQQYPNAPIPSDRAEAVRWIDTEIDAMLSDESNTKNAYNNQYLRALCEANLAIHEAQRYEPVGEEVGASV